MRSAVSAAAELLVFLTGKIEWFEHRLRNIVCPQINKSLVDIHSRAHDYRGVNLSPTLWGSKVPPLLFPPLRSRPFNPARGLGERCKLHQWGLGRSASRQRFWCIFRVKERCWWHSRCTVWKIKKRPFFTTVRFTFLWRSFPRVNF